MRGLNRVHRLGGDPAVRSTGRAAGEEVVRVWLEDLVWRENRWRVDPDHTHNSGLAKLIQKVEREYRIPLSRALHGLFVWIKDEETREHVLESLAIRRIQRLPRVSAF